MRSRTISVVIPNKENYSNPSCLQSTTPRMEYIETKIAPFLHSLQTILETEDPTIIRWTEDGKAFEIVDMDAMAMSILPRYFRHSKIASFQRQLNYFGFKKWSKTKTTFCTYSHQHFLRDDPESIVLIRRKTTPEYVKYSTPISTRYSLKRSNTFLTSPISTTPTKHHKFESSPSSYNRTLSPVAKLSTKSTNFWNKKPLKESLIQPGEFVEDKDWIDDLDYLTKTFATSPQGNLVDIPFDAIAYEPCQELDSIQSMENTFKVSPSPSKSDKTNSLLDLDFIIESTLADIDFLPIPDVSSVCSAAA